MRVGTAGRGTPRLHGIDYRPVQYLNRYSDLCAAIKFSRPVDLSKGVGGRYSVRQRTGS